jgi:hypothetical protein
MPLLDEPSAASEDLGQSHAISVADDSTEAIDVGVGYGYPIGPHGALEIAAGASMATDLEKATVGLVGD